MRLGLLLSLATVVFWSLENVFWRYAVTEIQAYPAVVTCISMFTAGSFLILIAGPGSGGINTLKLPHTWMYGIFQILMTIAEVAALKNATTTEVNLIFRMNIIFSLAFAWMFLNRKPYKSDIISVIPIVSAAIYIGSQLPENVRYLTFFYVLLASMFQVIKTAIVETHPEINAAKSIKASCRVTGYVIFINSFIFIILISLFSVASPAFFQSGNGSQVMDYTDILAHAFQFKIIAVSMLGGALVTAPGMYLSFMATRFAKTEVFLAMIALLPVITYAYESIFGGLGLLDMSTLTDGDLVAGLVITVSGLLMVYMRWKNENLQPKSKS